MLYSLHQNFWEVYLDEASENKTEKKANNE